MYLHNKLCDQIGSITRLGKGTTIGNPSALPADTLFRFQNEQFVPDDIEHYERAGLTVAAEQLEIELQLQMTNNCKLELSRAEKNI